AEKGVDKYAKDIVGAYDPLPLASLRLLVPPLQLMAASMWQVFRKRDVMSYWKVSDFVSLVVDMVPELLMDKHRTQLNLGLRARVSMGWQKSSEIFFRICIVFHHSFFALKDIFPAEYGPLYDSDLQTLFAEFLCRLFQLVPVPDLEQVSLNANCTCNYRTATGNCRTLSMIPIKETRFYNTNLHVETQPAPEIAEIVTVSDYSEVEIGASSNVEVVTEENCFEGREDTVGECSLVVYLEKTSEEEPKREPTDLPSSSQHKAAAGPHDCHCGKVFRFHSLLKAHQRVHTGEQPFSCSQCGRQFSFKQSLERHKQTHSSGNKLSCLICGDLFKSATEHARHKSSHLEDGDYQCSECGQTFMEDSFKCSHCNLGFSCERQLNKHILTHKEEKPHSCNCGKSFPYRAALTAHQRTHQRERPHICTQCGKGFLYKGGLLSHMKIHSEEMPFMCSFCGKSFKRERNMKKHERCHTRENVFRCSQCDKSFVYKATLIRHELTHSGERPYLCSDCGKGFFSHAELLKHERFHTGHKPFQCPHCGKKFTQSCYLTIHLRYHTGARPYSCSECDKSFLSANRLKRHQRTHSGEKPYPCLECGKGFRQSYHLKTHLRTHLREQEIVKPPAHVLRPGIHHVGPEGVGVGLLRVKLTEAVHEAGRQQLAEPFALLRGEARILLVALRVLQVDLLMRNVEIAAQHQGLLDVELAQVSSEVYVPGFTVI
uniref:Zinc finger protein 585A-like n=1 Tax=Poecilia latipinna TaxID=48699 RepID=A0A3B3VLB5_9TELE